jgi:hypothetical protein
VGLAEQLALLEGDERAYRASWNEVFRNIRMRELAGNVLWTLQLTAIPWVTPYKNRVGICAYVYTDPELHVDIMTIGLTPDALGQWDPMDLAHGWALTVPDLSQSSCC